jgi:hypothetical protein
MQTMLINAVKLFIAGKLFRNNLHFFRQWGIGFAVAVVLIAGLSLVNPWLGMAVGGSVSGALLPWLFKDLKYN